MERAKQRQQATNRETLKAKAVAGLGQLDAAQLAALRGLVAQGPAALLFQKRGTGSLSESYPVWSGRAVVQSENVAGPQVCQPLSGREP
jgi:hypothetical protein